MMLQLKVSQGQEWSEKDFKDTAKQGILDPNSADNLVYQISNNVDLSLFFFGDGSVLTVNLRGLHCSIRTHIITFLAAQLHSSSFAAEFFYAIDTQTFRWLEMYHDAADGIQVGDTLVNIDTLLQSVLIENFLQPLPDLIVWISNKHQHTDLTNNAEGARGKKRKKQETCLVDNPQMGPDWKLRPGEKRGNVFAGRCLECQPDYNRQKVCHRR